MTKQTRFPQNYRLMMSSFALSVIQDEQIASVPLAAQAKQAYQSGQKPEFSFTPEMAYHYNVNHFLRRLVGTIERIEQVPVFLRRFPNSKFYKDNEITLHSWINYHYTSFLIMSVSLYDISLLLTNEIFLLGINPKHCSERTVGKHKLVRETNVFISLDNIGKAIDEYREERHFFVHRGHTPKLGFMDDLDAFDGLQQAEKALGKEFTFLDANNPISSPTVRQLFYGIERRKLTKQIIEKTDTYASLLLELFDSLKPIYDVMSKRFVS